MRIVVNGIYRGSSCIPPLWSALPRYGRHYNAIQLEISYTLRRDYRGELVAVLAEIAREFHQCFGVGSME